MAKDKKGSKAAAVAAPKPVASKTEKVKAGRVTKPAESKKASSKDTAKKTAKVVEKKSKKKEPTPEPSSSEEEDDTSASSDSSDSDSEQEAKPAKANGKVNGAAKATAKDDSSDSDSDSSESEAEAPAAKGKKAAKVNGAAKAAAKDDSSDSDSSSASDSDEEAAPKTNGKVAAAETSDSDEDSENSSSDSDEENVKAGAKADADDSSDSSSSDEEEEEETHKVEEKPSKKRKAEDAAVAATPKRTKMNVNGEEKEVTGNLFCGNLSWNVDEDWLTREFEEFGELSGVRIITDRDSGRSKGFGYVEFVNPDHAAAAVESKQGTQIDGREIRLDFSTGRQNKADGQTPQQRSSDRAARYGDVPKEPSSTLFVGNISFDATQDMVYETFQEFGTINGVRLPTDRETGAPKGFGYVEMGSIEEAKAAMEGLVGADIAGRTIRLDYSTPKPPTEGGRGGGFGGGRGGGRGGVRGRGGFDRGGGRGGRGGRGGGRGGSFNRGGFGDFSGQKKTFD